MATISGFVLFDRNRTNDPLQSVGIANIPVVLQNTVNNMTLTVLTGVNGSYSFINVPNGSYRIVLSYGMPGVASPGDFLNAVIDPEIPESVNPPISVVSNPPTGATNLDSVTPGTLLVTVLDLDLTNQNFLIGPVRYIPIQSTIDECSTIIGGNLITDADNGTFGTFPAGTPANTGAPGTAENPPYPGVTPDFTYVQPNPEVFAPMGGEYTVQNILNNAMSAQIGAWWRIADHTSGNETGRFMLVNGDVPGSVFFRSTLNVNMNTNYLFSAWILNMFRALGFPNPALAVRILDQNGEILYFDNLGVLIPVNLETPEWRQIGTVINSQSNTSLTVEFISMGPEEIGNDYAIDDVSFYEISIPIFTPVKTVNPSTAGIGETVTFTITLSNTCQSPLMNVLFQDIIPNELTFIPGSVTVNGIPQADFNPNIGFNLPDVTGGTTVTVAFSAVAASLPETNPVINTADMSYLYTPFEGGIPLLFDVTSNEAAVQITPVLGDADVSVVKTGSPASVRPGETVTFTLTVANAGPADAENVVVTDELPEILVSPEYSLDGGMTFQPWQGSFNFGTMAAGSSRIIIIRALVPADATMPFTNIATVSSTTPDPNPDNNRSVVTTNIFGSRCQALADVVKSVALIETAISHILNAEGEKMQSIIGMTDVTNAQLAQLNRSVTGLIGKINTLESILQLKLAAVSEGINNCQNL